jgi:rhodanese-related sulfurtransferase
MPLALVSCNQSARADAGQGRARARVACIRARAVLKTLYTRLLAAVLPQGRAPRIDAAEAARQVTAGRAVLLDVREHAELASGLAAPARWVPMSEFSRKGDAWTRVVAMLPRDQRVIVYCAAGARAGRVADDLAHQGFETANLGGFFVWTAAGLPVRECEPDIRERLGLS